MAKKISDKEAEIRAIVTPYTQWIFDIDPEAAKKIVDKYFKQRPLKLLKDGVNL